MVLRSQSVGEQDVADQQGAFCARMILSFGLWSELLRPEAFYTHFHCEEYVNPILFRSFA